MASIRISRQRLGVARAAWGLIGATFLLALGICAAVTWRDYRVTIEAETRQQAEVVRLMAEHTRGVLATNFILLNRMEAMVKRYGLDGFAPNSEAEKALVRLKEETPNINSLWILDRGGNMVATTIPNVSPLNYADREYFKVAEDSDDHADYISPLIIGRVTGDAIFSLTRRLSDAGGRFQGVLQVAIKADSFTHAYAEISEESGDSFGVYKMDGSIVLRQPPPSEGKTNEKIRAEIVRRTAHRPGGSYIEFSVVDGIRRLYAYQIMPDAGLILIGGRPMTVILAPWWGRTIRNNVMAALGLSGIGVMAYLTMRAARRADEANQAMREALRSRATFFASASHDLRQPYQALRLFWAVIDQRARAGSDTVLQTAVERMGNALLSGEQLLSTLLDVAVLEAGRIVPRYQTVSLGDLIESEVSNLQALAQSRGLRLSWVKTSVQVETDPVLLRRILRNLLVNAIKFTDQGGVVIGCRHRDGAVAVEVWDSGRGIAEEHQKAVFEDLFQIGNPSRTRSEGLGLGLSIVSRTAHLLGYEIGLRSLAGRGSVFSVLLKHPHS